MKKPSPVAMPAPPQATRRVARTRFEIAAQLLRLEFERARVIREIKTAELRASRFSRRLTQTSDTIRKSLTKLLEGTDP